MWKLKVLSVSWIVSGFSSHKHPCKVNKELSTDHTVDVCVGANGCFFHHCHLVVTHFLPWGRGRTPDTQQLISSLVTQATASLAPSARLSLCLIARTPQHSVVHLPVDNHLLAWLPVCPLRPWLPPPSRSVRLLPHLPATSPDRPAANDIVLTPLVKLLPGYHLDFAQTNSSRCLTLGSYSVDGCETVCLCLSMWPCTELDTCRVTYGRL